jgi:predicted acylesterase/phospholipase RssA/CRP-like cAMP-binding protein
MLADVRRIATDLTTVILMDASARDSLEAAVCRNFGVSAAEAPALVAEFERVVCRGGEWLFREGETGDSLYLLVRGRLQVWIGEGEAARLVADVEPGEMIGEIALLAGGARSAGVRALRDSLLLRLDTSAFDRIAAKHPAWLRQMAGGIAVRLRDRTGGAGPRRRFLKTVAIVPLDDPAAASALATRLAGTLRRHGPVATLTPERLAEFGGGTDATDAARVDRLAALEDDHRFLLYVASPSADAWSQLAVRHADLVLLVARDGASAALRPWETELFDERRGAGIRRALVLLHEGAPATLRGTGAWLEARRPDFHLHVREGVPGDFDRLARVLSGEAVGLVLGGGAARGFAHLGAYRALQEAGIAVDWVGGASIGSVMGAAVALGLPPDEAIALARRAFVAGKPFGDVTLPVVSLLRGRRMERLLAQHLPGAIEDLPVPYFCVSSNLGAGTLQVHDTGPIAPAVRASVSLPGVFPPAVVDGQLTIDGGILDNLPVDLMRRRPVARVVAVDVTSRQTYAVDYASVPSPWAVLAGRWLPFAKRRRVPSFMSLMLKATEIGTMAEVRSAGARADLLIRPAVSRFGITDVRSFDLIVQAGYEEARRAIDAWRNVAPGG